jgi:hypothetical protein
MLKNRVYLIILKVLQSKRKLTLTDKYLSES